jgi:hypothetical protein
MNLDILDRWPLIEIDGREFYLKYDTNYSECELRFDYSAPINSKLSFEMAQAVGYKYHPEIKLHTERGILSSAEEKVGETLDKPPFNFDTYYTMRAFFPSHIWRWRYKKLLRMFGQSMVPGDIYRIFSNMSDSSFPNNLAYDGEHLRWIDFGDSFSSESFGYYWSDIQHYFRKVRKIWKSKGEDVLQKIQDLDDSTIEEIVNSVLFHPDIVRLASNAPIKEAYGKTFGETLQSYAEKVIGFIKHKRDMMRTLV